MFSLDFTPEDFRKPNRFCVYSHTVPDSELAKVVLDSNVPLCPIWPDRPDWIGFCRLADVLIAPDAHACPEWRETVLPAPMARLAVISTHDTEPQAMRAALAAVRSLQPRVNLLGGNSGPGLARRVLCVDTGVIYESAAAAAKAHGIYASQMSVYLNRREGGTIRGLTFKRV